MKGKLFVCATPIGNLKDITLRCLETLKDVDLIAAEDTRHTIKLLNHYKIKVPLESYHEHNKASKGRKLINLLLDGKNIALVSDAGMPGICDPGEDLIKLCYENEIPVIVLPGATASITALILSGIKTRSYCFEGFLPSNKKAKKEVIEWLKNDTRTYIIYEAPHHLLQTLKDIFEQIGERNISIVKELTKKHETVFRTNLSSAIQYFENNEPKGEYVLVLEGIDEKELINKQKEKINNISIEEHFKKYISLGIETKEAMKKVAKERGLSKREVYNEVKIKNN